VGFPHVRVGHRQAPIPKPLISLAGRGFCFGARKSRSGRSGPGVGRITPTALSAVWPWPPAAPGLAWARAVASVYRRITANGYPPYVMLGLAVAMGIASLNAILRGACTRRSGPCPRLPAVPARFADKIRSYAAPPAPFPPCRSAACARIAGRAREGLYRGALRRSELAREGPCSGVYSRASSLLREDSTFGRQTFGTSSRRAAPIVRNNR